MSRCYTYTEGIKCWIRNKSGNPKIAALTEASYRRVLEMSKEEANELVEDLLTKMGKEYGCKCFLDYDQRLTIGNM